MRSKAQINASRANGAKSHGPVTAQGKAISSQNAVKNGLSARTVVLACESHELFQQLEQNYIDSLQPCTVLELHLVQRIAVAEWRMRRAWSVATAIADKSMMVNRAQDERDNPGMDDDYRIGVNQQRVEKELAAVERAEARFERTQARAMAEFHRLRKLRPAEAQPIQVTRPRCLHHRPRSRQLPSPGKGTQAKHRARALHRLPRRSQTRRRRVR